MQPSRLPIARPLRLLSLGLLTVPGTLASPALSQTLFTEVGPARGIERFVRAPGISAGMAAEDFDRDGDIDLFVPNGIGATDQLYVNDGTGHFTESAAARGLAASGNHRAALWFDANGDGLLDLVTVGDCFEDILCTGGPSIRLYLQSSAGQFHECTYRAGLGRDLNLHSDTHVGGLAAGDIDGDGDLDLLVCFWEGLAHLYINDGQAHFVDRALERGIQVEQNHWQPIMFDFSGDGHTDIFQAVDFTENRFWINQGNATFVDQAPALGMDNAFNEMGVNLGDFDRDGDLDFYVTNIFNGFGRHNLLYQRGTAALAYQEVSAAYGVQDSGCGWGNALVDVELDGWPDLLANDSCPLGKTRMFKNDLATVGHFSNVSARVGLHSLTGTGLVTFDMDGDGDLDVAQVDRDQLRLFENRHVIDRHRRFLIVRPRQSGANPTAIGAKITVIDGPLHTARAILAGSSIMCQEPAEAHFGLGQTDAVDVQILWPDGTLETIPQVAANQVLYVSH